MILKTIYKIRYIKISLTYIKTLIKHKKKIFCLLTILSYILEKSYNILSPCIVITMKILNIMRVRQHLYYTLEIAY